jgi:hypothetical protein
LEAIDTLTRGLKIYDDVTGPNNVRSAIARHYLGKGYAKQSNHPEAIAQFSQALKIVESSFGRDHILSAKVMKDLAISFMETGKMREAKELLTRAESLFIGSFGAGNELAYESQELLQRAKAASNKVI